VAQGQLQHLVAHCLSCRSVHSASDVFFYTFISLLCTFISRFVLPPPIALFHPPLLTSSLSPPLSPTSSVSHPHAPSPLLLSSQVAKAAIIIGDPSYFPEAMSRKMGKVVRSICLLDHTIAGMFLSVDPVSPVYAALSRL
jgi:GDP dissociation inhibitor